MLQVIRSAAASLIFKILFAVLIVTFGLWGIGDVFRNRTVDTSVAHIGSQSIRAEELAQAVHLEIKNQQRLLGPSFDVDQAKRLGIVDDELDKLVSRLLFGLEVDQLKLAASDDAVFGLIRDDATFKDENGHFDATRYQQILAGNHLTHADYVIRMRNELLRGELIEAVTAGGAAPAPLADAIYRHRAEKRGGDLVFIPASSIGDIGQPTDADLAAFHDQHPDEFRAPELRSFTIASLEPDDLAQTITVSEDDIKDAYQKRTDELQIPERRHIEQMLVKDDTMAQQAADALKSGKSFASVAKDIAKSPTGALDLGLVSRDQLPASLADAAFGLEKDAISDPVKTPFGWNILHVLAIEPPKTLSYDEAKAKLAAEVAKDQAADQIGDIINKVQDALAGGASLDDTARKFDLKLAKVADSDQTGKTLAGTAVALPEPSSDILHSAFAIDAGQASGVADTPNGGFYIVHVDGITPARVRPLAEVRDQTATAWRQDKVNERLAQQAKDITHAVNGGTDLKDIAAQRKLKVVSMAPIERSGGGSGDLPAPLIAKLFELKLHQAASGAGTDGYFVTELTQIETPDPGAGKTQTDQISRELGSAIQNDLAEELAHGLRGHFKVTIDRAAVDRAL